jgi:PST family polysaccharide transporter
LIRFLKPFGANGAFQSRADEGKFRRIAVRSAGVTVLSQGVSFAVQMIATVVLARLLTPADFGVVTIVTTFSLLLVSFGQIGIPEAVVQREEIDHFLTSNLFWMNVGAALLLTIAFAAAGSLLARLYGDPRLAQVAVGVSPTICVTSLGILHLALLKRAMRFSEVAANDFASRIVSVAVTILLGWLGWGYWALVAGAVAQAVATSIGAWTLCRWVPSLPRGAAGTGSTVRFAMSVYGRWTVDYLAQNMDNLLVGWRFGSGSLGSYKKAYDLFALPSSQLLSVYPVAVATLSRLNRDAAQYRRYFLGGLSLLALLGMGIGADLTLVGKDLVRLVLGPGWGLSGEMFMFFGPGIGIMLIYGTHGMIHLSIGTTTRYIRWGIIEFTVTGLLFLLALPWGPTGIAGAWTASFWILIVPAFWYAGKPIHLGITPVLAAIWKYAVASFVAGCASAVIIGGIPSLLATPGAFGAAVRIVTTSLLFAVLYIGAIIVLHRGCAPLYEVVRLLDDFMPRKGTTTKPNGS